MRKYLFLSIFFGSAILASASYSSGSQKESICVDHPEEAIKQSGKCRAHATKTSVISAQVYNAVSLCLRESEKIEFNEFIVDWNIGSGSAMVSVYENAQNYFLQFEVKGDLGGGMECLYVKKENKVKWVELTY